MKKRRLECGCIKDCKTRVIDVCPYHFDMIFAMVSKASEK